MAHHISPAEKQRRQDSVAAAIHSAWLEGAEVSQETQDDMQEYVEGGITVEEGLARLRERIDRHVRERRNTVA
ncbi:antitoxin VbhA family protein [Hoyosella sp. YIM 151337]|uniref:antitoxin VbhA family protein n=1 Tax=Hoyosella sp. YIM 151337 TaxID=2992742 RepID=UPI002235FED9|nr:antitoxin VbhA family protein [Hoyosella sp. YIM 151337]MCW4355658.1 antitoxin VbhA family protein [Hoyosella sp. YIM 151337]MCW4355660.1 antitoxin VbhA family protein [Hoyosella sp. YIM 151337]